MIIGKITALTAPQINFKSALLTKLPERHKNVIPKAEEVRKRELEYIRSKL